MQEINIAAIATATSTGKKTTKAGVRTVPKPKPEKKVRPDAAKATMLIMKISMLGLLP